MQGGNYWYVEKIVGKRMNKEEVCFVDCIFCLPLRVPPARPFYMFQNRLWASSKIARVAGGLLCAATVSKGTRMVEHTFLYVITLGFQVSSLLATME